MAERITILYPQENVLIFGCGVEALCKKSRKVRNRETGEEMIRFVMLPSKELIHKYNIIDNDYEQEHGMLEKDYPARYVKWLSMDSSSGAPIMILCAYDGSEDTELIKIDQENFKKIEELEKKVHHQEQIVAEKDEMISELSSISIMDKIKDTVENGIKNALMYLISKKKISGEED